MELVLTAEWIILLIFVLLLCVCVQVLLATHIARSRAVTTSVAQVAPAPESIKSQLAASLPVGACLEVAEMHCDPVIGFSFPPEPLDILDHILPRPCDSVPRAPKPALRKPSQMTWTRTTSQSVSSTSARSSQHDIEHPQPAPNRHPIPSSCKGHKDGELPTPTPPRPRFCTPLTFTAVRRCLISEQHIQRTFFALGAPLHPRQPAPTTDVGQLQTPSTSALRQMMAERVGRCRALIEALSRTHMDEMIPQSPIHPKRQLDILPAFGQALIGRPLPPLLLGPREARPPPVETRPPEPAATSCIPGPALWQPQVRLTLIHRQPMTMPREMQKAELLPKEENEMWRRRPQQSAPPPLPPEPHPPCPVSGARPRPLRSVGLPTLVIQKLNQCPEIESPVLASKVIVAVQPGPMIWRSGIKEPSTCTSVQLRKPEAPVWPITGNPHGPKRPETEPGLNTPGTPMMAPMDTDLDSTVDPKVDPKGSKFSKVVTAATAAEDLRRLAQVKGVPPRKTKGTKEPTKVPAPRPKVVVVKAPSRARDATKATESSQRSGSSHYDPSGTLDSTLGGPKHGWGRPARSSRPSQDDEPGPGHYSPKHPGVHGRIH